MIIHIWHNILGMPKHDLTWHENDVADELAELKTAIGIIDIWSEKSDIVYTYTRARWSGHKEVTFPLSYADYVIGAIYMFPKYTFRWLFFRIIGKRMKSKTPIREVRNPKKIHKLDNIAEKYGLDKDEFRQRCLNLMKYWVFLK